jgi:hypothetical protein
MTAVPKRPVSVYLSYARKDESLKQEFEDYLAILQQTRFISGWVERQIQPGIDWSQVIDPRLFVADLVLLLVSPGLLASGYCSGKESREAFERNITRKAVLVPILLHQVNLRGHLLETILSLPRNQKPVSSWPERSEAWWIIDQEIRAVIEARR